jgi:hypothetical protein
MDKFRTEYEYEGDSGESNVVYFKITGSTNSEGWLKLKALLDTAGGVGLSKLINQGETGAETPKMDKATP